MAQLLIVEDDRITALELQRTVARMGHTIVACVSSAAEAMAAVQAYRPDVVLLDIHLPGPHDALLTGLDIQNLLVHAGHLPVGPGSHPARPAGFP